MISYVVVEAKGLGKSGGGNLSLVEKQGIICSTKEQIESENMKQ